MKLRNLFDNDDDRAVSPVIGVILMVAITVILAAVIGTFVLGLGDQVQTTSPSASFSFDFSSNGNTLTITHDGGDGIAANELVLRGDLDSNDNGEAWADRASGIGDTVRAGDSATVADDGDYDWDDYSEGDGVRVVWEDSDSDSSSTLGRWSR